MVRIEFQEQGTFHPWLCRQHFVGMIWYFSTICFSQTKIGVAPNQSIQKPNWTPRNFSESIEFSLSVSYIKVSSSTFLPLWNSRRLILFTKKLPFFLFPPFASSEFLFWVFFFFLILLVDFFLYFPHFLCVFLSRVYILCVKRGEILKTQKGEFHFGFWVLSIEAFYFFCSRFWC